MSRLNHLAGVFAFLLTGVAAAEEAPLLVRARNFLVPPSTGPVTHVVLKNRAGSPYAGVLRVDFPEGWKTRPSEHAVNLAPGETKAFAFTLETASNSKDNVYPLRVRVEGPGGNVTSDQTVVCASAPYGKPTIDGDLTEWEHAIPLSMADGGKAMTVRTLWSRRQFCLAVTVDEAKLIGLGEASAETGMDALQFALSKAPKEPGEAAQGRYEFLVVSAGGGQPGGRCFLLCTPEQEASQSPEYLSLKGLEVEKAQVAVKRADGVTCYEVSVPFSLMRQIRPAPGRELCFSLLVHDPDGTGVRDLGKLMNLWEEHRQPGAWRSWGNVRWGEKTPYYSSIEFGLCSSIH